MTENEIGKWIVDVAVQIHRENKVIVELKCIEKLNNAHKKQLLTYLRLTGMRLGYLLNFGEALMKNGITRTVNRLIEEDQ